MNFSANIIKQLRSTSRSAGNTGITTAKKCVGEKLTVTYMRSGVMFFTFDDEPEVEQSWFIGSMNCLMMHAAEIYPYEIGDILSKWYPEMGEKFPNICKQCKWDDAEGNITVDVIWK